MGHPACQRARKDAPSTSTATIPFTRATFAFWTSHGLAGIRSYTPWHQQEQEQEQQQHTHPPPNHHRTIQEIFNTTPYHHAPIQ